MRSLANQTTILFAGFTVKYPQPSKLINFDLFLKLLPHFNRATHHDSDFLLPQCNVPVVYNYMSVRFFAIMLAYIDDICESALKFLFLVIIIIMHLLSAVHPG